MSFDCIAGYLVTATAILLAVVAAPVIEGVAVAADDVRKAWMSVVPAWIRRVVRSSKQHLLFCVVFAVIVNIWLLVSAILDASNIVDVSPPLVGSLFLGCLVVMWLLILSLIVLYARARAAASEKDDSLPT